jgi:hypothetical protein
MGSALALQSDSKLTRRRPGQRGKDLTGYEVADILRWHAQGLTQEQIAAKFEPPKAQSTISEALTRYGPDRTHDAKAILRGGAADMALNIVRRGQPKDQVQALKGLGVLEEQQHPGLVIQIGGTGNDVRVAVLSPLSLPSQSEGVEIP